MEASFCARCGQPRAASFRFCGACCLCWPDRIGARDDSWSPRTTGRPGRQYIRVPPVTPVLCFVRGEWPLLFPPDSYPGVRLEGPRSIKKLVLRDQVLDDPAISRVTSVLSTRLPPK